MKMRESAATDILSSLPIIACCIISVMILVGSFGHAMSRGFIDRDSGALDESCNRLLSAAMGLLTSGADDGLRYLAQDWCDRLKDNDVGIAVGPGASASIVVRVLGQAQSEFSLVGDTSLCDELRSASAPVLLVSGGKVSPGEVMALVGR
jgi:hypothetical protein